MDRRGFLRCLAAAVTLPAFPGLGVAADAAPVAQADPFYTMPRTLHLARGSQALALTYWRDGQLQVEDYAKLCWLLRDVQAGHYVQMDMQLLEVLRWIQHYARAHGFTQPLQILSGYRTLSTNTHTEGAARNSMHLYGKAVDFRLPGVSTESLGGVVRYLQQSTGHGGAGIYLRQDFVHADTGAVRSWRG